MIIIANHHIEFISRQVFSSIRILERNFAISILYLEEISSIHRTVSLVLFSAYPPIALYVPPATWKCMHIDLWRGFIFGKQSRTCYTNVDFLLNVVKQNLFRGWFICMQVFRLFSAQGIKFSIYLSQILNIKHAIIHPLLIGNLYHFHFKSWDKK